MVTVNAVPDFCMDHSHGSVHQRTLISIKEGEKLGKCIIQAYFIRQLFDFMEVNSPLVLWNFRVLVFYLLGCFLNSFAATF